MRRPARESGAASAVVMGVLALLSALFLGTAAFIEAGTAELARARSRDAEERRLSELASAAAALLLDDPTPHADSPFDPVWSGALAAGEGRAAEIPVSGAPQGYAVSLEDLSSRLGINWVRRELLAAMDVLKPEATARELQQYREDTGLHLDASRYERFVGTRDLEAFFTTRGWFNVNIADEFALRKVALERTGDLELAEDLRTRVQNVRIRRQPEDPLRLISREDLRGFLGPALADLFPIVGSEPAMNVHFAPGRVVEALVSHYNAGPALGERILAERAEGEMSEEQLAALLGQAATKTPLAHYLGVRTWFWRITVRGPSRSLEWVLARLPGIARLSASTGARDDEEPRLQVVEERWAAR